MKKVEEIPFNERGVEHQKADIIFSERNQSFYRKDNRGNKYCWMAVDANTGNVEFKDLNGKSLLFINAEKGKLIVPGNPSVDLQKEAPDDLIGKIAYEAKRLEIAPQKTLDQISKDGLMLQANQKLTTRQDGQLLINGKVFKGEKGDKPYVERIYDGVRITGSNGTATVKDGPKGENAPDVKPRIEALEHKLNAFVHTPVKDFDFNIPIWDTRDEWLEAYRMNGNDRVTAYAYLSEKNQNGRAAMLCLELQQCKSFQKNPTYPIGNERRYGAYLDYLITGQFDDGQEFNFRQGSIFCPEMGSITQTLNFIDWAPYAKYRTYRIKFKRGLNSKSSVFKGKFSAVEF
ncbi:MAG: hypothetical protein AB8G05_01460 [Oligoflexales bacterium]